MKRSLGSICSPALGKHHVCNGRGWRNLEGSATSHRAWNLNLRLEVTHWAFHNEHYLSNGTFKGKNRKDYDGNHSPRCWLRLPFEGPSIQQRSVHWLHRSHVHRRPTLVAEPSFTTDVTSPLLKAKPKAHLGWSYVRAPGWRLHHWVPIPQTNQEGWRRIQD